MKHLNNLDNANLSADSGKKGKMHSIVEQVPSSFVRCLNTVQNEQSVHVVQHLDAQPHTAPRKCKTSFLLTMYSCYNSPLNPTSGHKPDRGQEAFGHNSQTCAVTLGLVLCEAGTGLEENSDSLLNFSIASMICDLRR